MKALRIMYAGIFSLGMLTACNSSSTESTSPGVGDSSGNPTTDALDYHPDQRQIIPSNDSSNTVGTDTISGTTATPNTGTVKSYNDKKAAKDSMK